MSCVCSLLWLHQGFQTLRGTCRASRDRAVVVGGLESLLIFLGPNQTQDGSVEELVLLLKKRNQDAFFSFAFHQHITSPSRNNHNENQNCSFS